MSTKWINQDAKKVYQTLKKVYGEPTGQSIDSKDKIVIWSRKSNDFKKRSYYKGLSNCFEEIILRDESVKHNCPAKHIDFLYSYIKISIEPWILPSILSISGSVGYDPLKKLLYGRCASMEANTATLKLCTDIILLDSGLKEKIVSPIDGVKYEYENIKDVHAKHIYAKSIKAAISHPPTAKLFYGQLCNNLKLINKKFPNVWEGYWKAAFDGECRVPYQEYMICTGNK